MKKLIVLLGVILLALALAAAERKWEELAERANLSADFLGFIERGENVPTLTTILQLARALGVQPSKIIKDFDG